MFNMEPIELYLAISLLLVSSPSPQGALQPVPLRSLAKHGPIFSLRLGSRLAIAVTSPSAVEECLTKNDITFANRPYFWVGKYIGYEYTTLGSSPYGDHWKNLRRICKHEMFSTDRLNSNSSVRRDEIKDFLRKLYISSSHDGFVEVELKPMLSKLAFSIIMRRIAGKKYSGKPEAIRLHNLIQGLLKLGISPIIGDFFPFLQWADFQGYKKKVVKLAREIDGLLQGLIDEHRRNKDDSEKEDSMISHLLGLQESQAQYYTDEIIKGIVQDMLIPGTNTVVITLEWSMSHLLNNSNALQKSKSELDFHIGYDRLLEETDLPKLRYLQNVISETLRLNPATPLLIPHVASDHCNVSGYDIPKDTMLLVNAWAIQRDPKVWDEATSFKPERFENGRNEGCTMMPFGLGRRACPARELGLRVAGLALGSLIQCFEWKRVGVKKIDMTEGKGLNLPKSEPLQAYYKAHNSTKKLLS
ncbi:cytochrome P450, family 81, subfamily H, polypeptide 1 [Hibiscus trionum]|uniref:Cytochrome P450, family 81, subfamily H, polypeptide 1 n=1 Tax=Hibiscus trionum TaxID=183268 RepID=A0A9W7HMX2_HIBTR|nr:cytochrome P450, family 81, subfamily H, polypeptide 1 [Hibiscus trionum]